MTAATDDAGSATAFDLRGDREVVMTRVFGAPRALVWQAATRPGHVARWWGPRGYESDVRELDVRPGGRWRIHQRAPGGAEHAFWGEYLEVAEPERLVHTQHYLEYPPLLVTITFEDEGEGTRLTTVTRFDSPAVREATLAMGIKWGAVESWERLAELVATL